MPIKFSKRMERKYVAMVSFTDQTIIVFGKNPEIVLRKARKRGYKDPVIFFNPKTTDVLIGGIYYERDANGVLNRIVVE